MKNIKKLCPKGCEVVATTTELTGYPKNEGEAITGFKDKDQLKEFLSNHPDFDRVLLTRKPGWSHWIVNPSPDDDLIDNAAYLPDSYRWSDNKEPHFVDELCACADDSKEYADFARKLVSAYRLLKDDEIMVFSFDGLEGPEVIKRFSLYSNESWDDAEYSIGVVHQTLE